MAGKHDPEVIAKERQALELRRAGVTYDLIAERVGYSERGAARKAVVRALRRTLEGPAEDVRELEADRLDRLQSGLWAQAMKGNLGAVDRVLRLMERRARLLGLDQPTQVQAEHTGDIVLNFGIPRPNPAEADASAVPQAQLRALP